MEENLFRTTTRILSLDLLGAAAQDLGGCIFLSLLSIHLTYLLLPSPEMTWLSKADGVDSR